MQTSEITPEQYYINEQFAGSDCRPKHLMEAFGLTYKQAYRSINKAITIVKHQRRLELCIQSGEDSEEVLMHLPLKAEKIQELQTI